MDVNGLIERYKADALENMKWSRTRRRNMETLTEEATAAHKTGRYEVSMDKFVHILAILETEEPKYPSEMRATVTSNVASALHFLGEYAAAKEMYERALDEFSAGSVGWLTYLQLGNLNEKRCEYIQARLAQVATGERPDPSLYLDGYGKTRQWTQEELDGTDKSWSIFQPRTWWYGGYVPAGHTVVSGHTASGSQPATAI